MLAGADSGGEQVIVRLIELPCCRPEMLLPGLKDSQPPPPPYTNELLNDSCSMPVLEMVKLRVCALVTTPNCTVLPGTSGGLDDSRLIEEHVTDTASIGCAGSEVARYSVSENEPPASGVHVTLNEPLEPRLSAIASEAGGEPKANHVAFCTRPLALTSSTS